MKQQKCVIHEKDNYMERRVTIIEGSLTKQQDEMTFSWLLMTINPSILP